jgi:hypothetical protein
LGLAGRGDVRSRRLAADSRRRCRLLEEFPVTPRDRAAISERYADLPTTLGPAELSAHLHLGERAVRQLVRDGKLRRLRYTSDVRVSCLELIRFLDEQSGEEVAS